MKYLLKLGMTVSAYKMEDFLMVSWEKLLYFVNQKFLKKEFLLSILNIFFKIKYSSKWYQTYEIIFSNILYFNKRQISVYPKMEKVIIKLYHFKNFDFVD